MWFMGNVKFIDTILLINKKLENLIKIIDLNISESYLIMYQFTFSILVFYEFKKIY